ncbi:MAG: VCBS repeat-containing protein [Acidobacteria bacterium]|nr:VCBS repeat-containing protein [Acidobacteriota bacterium]
MTINKSRGNRNSRLLTHAFGLALVFALLAPARTQAAASQFDRTFGTGGLVFYTPAGGSRPFGDLEIQPDGKALVVGMSGFQIARFNANGTPDNTFDGDGVAQVPSLSLANAVAVQTDGKIVVAGTVGTDVVLARFNLNGSLDSTFGSNGISLLSIADTQSVQDVAIQPDGKIIVGGWTGLTNAARDFMVVRFNANGNPDAAFGPTGNGMVQVSFSNTSSDELSSISLQTDGKIVAGGNTNGGSLPALMRLTAAGALDPTFGTNGKLTTSVTGVNDWIGKTLIKPDGKIIAAGRISNFEGTDVCVIRYDTTGALDPGFGVNGVARTNDSTFDLTRGMALQPDGRIIVADYTDLATIRLIRFNSNGTLDASFHGDGIFPFPASDYSFITEVYAIAIQPDGKVMLAGQEENNIFLSRLLGDPRQIFTNFNFVGPADRTAAGSPPGLPSNYPSIADINGLGGTITKVRVTLTNFTHTFPADFDILLVGPQGQRTILMSDAGGGNPGVTGQTYVFDQSAAVDFPLNTNAPGGVYRPFNNIGSPTIEPGGIDNFPAPGPGSANYGAASLDVFNGTNPNGIWKLYAVDDETGDTGFFSTFTLEVTTSTSRLNNLGADFDGDGRTDISIFRPSNGQWWINRSSTGATIAAQFGQSTDIITPGDFTGDGKTDIAFWRPSTGFWFILRSEDGSFFSFPFGASGDIPVPADYDGDGRCDPAVFRAAAATWYISRTSDGGTTITSFGAATDKPVPADYDGDGLTDVAIFRPSDGSWWYVRSTDGTFRVYSFGTGTDKPVPGDWTGDGRADIAIFRPSTNVWYVQRSEDLSFFSFPWGAAGDQPAPGDYDGNGIMDATVFRPSTLTWYANTQTQGAVFTTFGAAGDRLVPGAFIP